MFFVADWVPRLIAEIDIVGEDGVGGRFAVVVDELGKFFQLLCGADVILAIVSWLQPFALTTL